MSQAGINSAAGSNPHIPTSFVLDVGTAIPSGNILDVNGGAGVTTSVGASNQIIITVASSGFTWNVVTAAMNPITLVAENGYITKGAGVVDFILPAAAIIGDTFEIVGYGNLWTIAQNAGQSIRLGSSATTAGVFGSLSASMVTDCIKLICVTTNLEFFIPDCQGNPLIA